MEEKKVTMDDAFKIWWFIVWRTALTNIGVFIILILIFSFIKVTEATKPLVSTICFILSLLIPTYFIKIAINRDFSNFRLSATSINSNKQSNE